MPVIVAVTIIFAIYALGEIVALKTKANLSSMLVVSLVLLLWFGLGLPEDLITMTGFIPVGSVLLGIVVAAMGNMLDFAELKRQWKTVVVTAIGVTCATALLIVIAIPLLGREITMAGAPVFAGASTAAMIMSETLTNMGRSDLVIFAILVLVTQAIVGIPIMSQLLKRAAKRLKASPESMSLYLMPQEETGSSARRRGPLALPESLNRPSLALAKLGVVATISHYVAVATNDVLNLYVVALILGCVLSEAGFLERNILEKTKSSELVMIIIMATLLSSLSEAKPELLASLAVPLITLLLIGAAFACLCGFLLSKLLKLDAYLAMSMCLACMMGFPATMFVPTEVSVSIGETPEEVEALKAYMVPKMITAGFVAGIVSMVIAGVVSTII